jgi:hypothetical protein
VVLNQWQVLILGTSALVTCFCRIFSGILSMTNKTKMQYDRIVF